MRYHIIVDHSDATNDEGYCDCGRYVRAVVRGYGPQTHFVYLDSNNSEECED